MAMWEGIADWVVYTAMGLDPATHGAAALHFFLQDVLKIGFLLLLIVHLMGAVNLYLPIERIRDRMAAGHFHGAEHLVASTFGAATPFCSCSSIPLFMGFLQGGIPLGVTFSFLITSPLVNEVALALFLGMFGWKVTVIYAASGILLGTVLGFVLGRLKLERFVEAWVWQVASSRAAEPAAPRPPLRLQASLITQQAFDILRGIWIYVIAGIGVGAMIHGYVPIGFFEGYLSPSNPLSVPLSVLLAVPMYASAAGAIPIIQALVAKGIPLGTSLAFMMAVVCLSLPEAMMLKKVMRPSLLGIFFGTVATAIIVLGYAFNLMF